MVIVKWLKSEIKKYPCLMHFINLILSFIKYLPHISFKYVDSKYELVRYEDGKNETFFGYYDKSPKNETGEYILYYSTSHPTKKKPDPNRPINLIVFDCINNVIVKRFLIYAYNWQQGSKVQWIEKYRFIFNNYDFVKKRYYSELYDVQTNISTLVDYPVYDVCNNKALSLNFNRLAILRPDYGYFNVAMSKEELEDISDDGVYIIDLERNSCTLLLSIERLLQTFPIRYDIEEVTSHKVNHIMFSPDGERFIFLHRFFINGKKIDRFFLYEFESQKITLLSDNDMVSHYSWIDNKRIIVYMRRFGIGDLYYVIDLYPVKITPVQNTELQSFGDGHPTVKNGLLVTDSYPDSSCTQYLLLYDFLTNKNLCLGTFHHSLLYSREMRCDLHPKWTFNGEEIFFDSIYNRGRHLYSLKLS
ncbi:hypothetical protein [Bacteroides fragilis]|uniref:hypothetical protein n=1 Tax=Bacteroides fragilis TaxID=817 RepID=UPI003305FB32|nr:hypothetical protein [Bacteroides fragilis]MCS2321633.1 hypothetical protein [Bacteroides fragilis]